MMNLTGKKCLIDTNILVAYINQSHSLHLTAKKLFQRIVKKEFKPVLSSQNLLELTAVLVHAFKISKQEAVKDVELFANDPLFEIIYPNVNVLNRFFDFMKGEVSIHTVDKFLISTALGNGVNIIITADKQFMKVKEIKTILLI
ncbi:MAG: type II toxin-antitoxin system VapC family toxin [Patescibacteria group bacterium]